MNSTMIRGNAAQTGFAASVSGWLRTYVYRARHVGGGLSMNARERLDRLESCASLPVGVGDADSRIRTLALATRSNRWAPGREQRATIDAAGHNVVGETVTLTPDDLLNALAHAAVLDLGAEHHRELADVKKGTEAAPTHEAIVSYERQRADAAEDRARVLTEQFERHRQEYIKLDNRYKELHAVTMGDVIADEQSPEPEPRSLPEGIRQKGSGYQGYFKVAGKTSSKILPTVEEAVRWRRDAMERATREQAAHDANRPGPQYDADVSPEDMAAQEEIARAA